VEVEELLLPAVRLSVQADLLKLMEYPDWSRQGTGIRLQPRSRMRRTLFRVIPSEILTLPTWVDQRTWPPSTVTGLWASNLVKNL
jgi:hypothetical protein